MKIISLFLLYLAVFSSPAMAETKIVTSKGGITAWLAEDHTHPVISLSFAFRGGIEQDPDAKQGLSYLAANMLTQGAGEDDANSFHQKLKDNSITLDFEARRDAVYGNVRSLKETWPEALRLLKASLTSPRFEEDALAREKAKTETALRLYLSDPDWLLSRMQLGEVFAGHPYARRTLGTFATQKSITVADLRAWHQGLGRDGLVIGAAGGITAEELGKVLDDVFGTLPAKKTAIIPDAQIKGAGGTFQLKHPGGQTLLMLTFPGILRSDPDWYAAEVMDYILGGGSFSSRLMNEIRDKRGLTYGIRSTMMAFDHGSLYVIQASAADAKAASVLELTRAEIAKLRDAPVTAGELQAAKDYLIGAYAVGLTSTPAVAQHLSELQRQHLPADEQKRRAAAIAKVTAADVRRVAKRLLPDGKEAVFWVGQPEGMKADKVFEKVE